MNDGRTHFKQLQRKPAERGLEPQTPPLCLAKCCPSSPSTRLFRFRLIFGSPARREPAATEDVVQEMCIVIDSRLHTLEQPQALRSWIYGVVRRTVSRHHRSRWVKEASGAALAGAPHAQPLPPTPVDLVEQKDKVKLLFILLEELDEPKREVFMMAELAELTVAEIAELLEIPLSTAYSRLRAARRAFEEALVRHSAWREGGGGS
jgi:RNA polymerase sigma-70 factor, ECF subfamily